MGNGEAWVQGRQRYVRQCELRISESPMHRDPYGGLIRLIRGTDAEPTKQMLA